ncbi:hypothetical protein CR105_09605 [Massilia eurypsychrophila]|uniref:Uncharacterized protein n=1 Tax=Massilia eurypsychrophila TaxID=1485217 RepID=A0A2G8THJ1_9BURK|nr:hypothetical protein [Massilia eurypsychrophila]PIL45409.1 hypothetical protein CR105_09605 [Massilia eurypsychrophila]
MINKLMDSIDQVRALRVRHMSRYWKATAVIPASLFPYWQRTAQFEFKGIPQDAFFFARATEGLLTFFDCVRTSGKRCLLPSIAADSVWHAWARMDARSLDAFCIQHFGRTIAHVDQAEMGPDMENALATCIATARQLRGGDPSAPIVPRLFALDGSLFMPGGYGYRLVQGQVGCRRLDQHGRPEGALFYPVGMTAAVDLTRRDGSSCGAVAGCGGDGCDGGGGCGGD